MVRYTRRTLHGYELNGISNCCQWGHKDVIQIQVLNHNQVKRAPRNGLISDMKSYSYTFLIFTELCYLEKSKMGI